MKMMGRISWRLCAAAAVLGGILAVASSCEQGLADEVEKSHTDVGASIVFRSGSLSTRSESPDEDLITDVNILIFNSYGLLEKKVFLKSSQMTTNEDGDYCYEGAELLCGCTYSIYACANTGFSISCTSIEEVLSYKYYLAYPDDYRIGVPMSGIRKDFEYNGESEIIVPMHRTMAKVSVCIDRSALDDDVEFTVTSVTVGNCPKSVRMFYDNSVEGEDDVYTVGFQRSDSGVYDLNRSVSGQTSGEVSLYMFENLQGTPLGEIDDYDEKEFVAGDALADRCSYIEIEAYYLSDSYYSKPGESLIYRFYLGESPSDFNVCRNCHYHVTVRPEGSGLSGSGWRVDKSGLVYCGPASLSVSPGNYIRGDIGDVINVRCTVDPEYAPFDIGLEELEFDKENGIYDYVIDEDGHGVTLTLTAPGSGILYFEAGDPVSDSAAVLVEVNLPDEEQAAAD